MDRYLDLLRAGGTLTYFAYVGTARARRLLSSPAEARRHRDVGELLAAYQRKYGIRRRLVLGNVRPARVWQLRGQLAVTFWFAWMWIRWRFFCHLIAGSAESVPAI